MRRWRARVTGRGRSWRNALAHAQHAVYLGDAEPVEYIRHQCLEAHILNAGHILGPLEVVGGAILTTLAGVVHDCGCELSVNTRFAWPRTH